MITVRYFGSLRETLGRSSDSLELPNAVTVLEIWNFVHPSLSLNENTLTAVNMDYVSRSHLVIDGDEVAFFPPVTGG